jgi:hypothetical protein
MCDLNKINMNDTFHYINQEENENKIWTNSFRGNIVKSVYDAKMNKIYQYSIPYNQINNYKKFFDSHMKNKNNDFSCKIVNRNLELFNKLD